MSRTSLAVVLLLLAFGLSAPALVGPMLVDTPAHQNVSPETPQRVSFAPRPAAEAGVPRFGRDVAATASGLVPQLDGAELGRALGTPAVPQGFSSWAIGGGGTGWGVGSVAGNGRRRASEDRIFTSGGDISGATPGLLGWGLRDARGSAAATAAANRLRPAAAGSNGSSGGGSQRGGQSGNVDAEADEDATTDDEDGADVQASLAGDAGDDDQSAGPASQNAINTVEPKVTNGGGSVPGVLGRGQGSPAPGGNMPAATPEPATLLLVGSGAAIAGLYRARRRPR